MKKAIIAYIRALHGPYVEFIERHLPVSTIFLLTADVVKTFDAVLGDRLTRDITAIKPQMVQEFLAVHYGLDVKVLMDIEKLKSYTHFVMPDEDVSDALKSKIHWAKHIQLDQIKARYDWKQTTLQKDVVGKYPISTAEYDRTIMRMLRTEAEKSTDIWRQVGAAVPVGHSPSQMLMAHNKHMPDPLSVYEMGDPRLHMKPGENPDLCAAIHAERAIIAMAAKREDIGLNGKSMYVTTFPCNSCAQMIAEAGIRKVFFQEGYSNVSAEEIFQRYDIEVFQVK
jgi:dCMP deaminase